jgi:hypothetical protein
MSYKLPPIRRKLYTIVLIGIIVSIVSLLFSTLSLLISLRSEDILSNLYQMSLAPSITPSTASKPTTRPNASKSYAMHILGAFSATTPDRIVNTWDNGIKDILYYGNTPAANSTQGLMLQALNMKMIDGFVSSELYYYECQRGRAMILPPSGLISYCGQDALPTFASEGAFLATIAAHLKQAQNNDLIIGYWVLDDWASWDPGGARQLLIKVHQLIQQYTPDRPAICGFGGFLTTNQTFSWSDWLAENFSPQGCDEVGLYIYANSASTSSNLPTPETFDWSMSAILPAIFASLRQRGWSIDSEPLIGIGQAFGGLTVYNGIPRYNATITAKDIETQSLSFCEHGASGLAFFAWGSSGFGASSQMPMDSSAVETGIRDGIAACTQYWSNHS